MLASFRRLTKSTVGTILMAGFLLLILASFALGDIANLGSGNFGLGSSTLAQVGGQQVTDRDMSRAMERRLTDSPAKSEAIIRRSPRLRSASREPDRSGRLQDFAQIWLHPVKLLSSGLANIPCARADGRFATRRTKASRPSGHDR